MRYEDMPKGRNKDRCVRCGKRYNFADKALSKAKVPYDLLCLAEVTASGYMTHGNVKLCDECMVELLMWLDRKTENSSEKPNNSTISKMEQVEEPMKTTDYCNICKRDVCEICVTDATNPYCVPSHYEINYEPKDEPQTCSVNGRPYSECGSCEHFKCTADEPQTERSSE